MLFPLCADLPNIGRVESASLTDQQVMELFFAAANPEDARRKLGGDESDACTWNTVSCVDGLIEDISWIRNKISLHGSIDFTMVPRNLVSLQMEEQGLFGTIETTSLPRFLEYFIITDCGFIGTLDLGALPRELKNFTVAQNKVTAVQNIRSLPPHLHTLDIIEKHLPKGTSVHVGKIPRGISFANFLFADPKDFIFANEADKERFFIAECWDYGE